MKVVCDTHIWYYLGKGTINPQEVSHNSELYATFTNIDELSRTFNLIVDSEYVRNAIRAIFKNSYRTIYEPPLIYLKKLSDSNYKYDIKGNHGQILQFTSKIAKGYEIDNQKKDEYKKYCQARHDGLQKAADLWNAEANEVRKKITDKKSHRADDTIPLNRNLISIMVATIDDGSGLSGTFDWSKIELFENTFKEFLTELEVSKMKVQPNDWFDILQLIYVQPGDKIWIMEKRWIRLITQAGMHEYIYFNGG